MRWAFRVSAQDDGREARVLEGALAGEKHLLRLLALALQRTDVPPVLLPAVGLEDLRGRSRGEGRGRKHDRRRGVDGQVVVDTRDGVVDDRSEQLVQLVLELGRDRAGAGLGGGLDEQAVPGGAGEVDLPQVQLAVTLLAESVAELLQLAVRALLLGAEAEHEGVPDAAARLVEGQRELRGLLGASGHALTNPSVLS